MLDSCKLLSTLSCLLDSWCTAKMVQCGNCENGVHQVWAVGTATSRQTSKCSECSGTCSWDNCTSRCSPPNLGSPTRKIAQACPSIFLDPVGVPSVPPTAEGCDCHNVTTTGNQEGWLCPSEEFGVHVWVVHSFGIVCVGIVAQSQLSSFRHSSLYTCVLDDRHSIHITDSCDR